MASELRVDRIIPINGVATGQSGGLVQVVHGKLSTPFAGTGVVGNDYWVNIGLNATITPISPTNNIMIIVNMYIGKDTVASGYQQEYRVLKNGSNMSSIYGTPSSTAADHPRYGVTGRVNMYNNNDNSASTNTMNQYHMAMLGGTHIDNTVGSTSAITYRVDMKGYTVSPTIYVNRGATVQISGGGGLDYDGVPQSTITLMELSA